MHEHTINGVTFFSEKDISYFLRKRSPRLHKKMYTGEYLTVLLSVRFMLTKEHYEKIVEKAKSLSSNLVDIDDYILSLSYKGDDFDFKRSNLNHYLGIMFGSIADDHVLFTSIWEIHAPDEMTFKINRKSLIKKMSSYLEVDNIQTFDLDLYDEIESKDDEKVVPWNGENVIAYSTKNTHVND